MTAQIVHDDDIAGCECRHKELLDPTGEALAIDGSVEDARRIYAIRPKCCDEGQGRPFPKGCSADQLMAALAPASDRGHVGLGPCFIDEDETPGIKPALIFTPLRPSACYRRPLLLDGEQSFF